MKSFLAFASTLLLAAVHGLGASAQGRSAYTLRPDDPQAEYFDASTYGIRADGKTDVSQALQMAIDKVKREKAFGILYIPEGKYLISKTIYVPNAIRLIGYGAKRPEIILAKDSPGFQDAPQDGAGGLAYMLWFTGGPVEEGCGIVDANAGTFYSAVSNIDFRIQDGNPTAVALRTHFAQHSFVSHCDIHAGKGYAGLCEVGNEMEDVRFYGGRYGIVSGRPSPSWPMMMVDVDFEGQAVAAIRSMDASLTMVHVTVRDTPTGIEIPEGRTDHLYVEDALFEDVGVGVSIGEGEVSSNQVNIVDAYFRKVPVAIRFAKSGEAIEGSGKQFRIKSFSYGLTIDGMDADSEFRTLCDMESAPSIPDFSTRRIPALPDMRGWVSVKDFGAVGDGEADDTESIRRAMASGQAVYFPTGWYRITSTLRCDAGTALIGMHPFATQLLLEESTPAFSGFGAPVPMLESSVGGDDILYGIGVNTGAMNDRAVGVKWMAGAASYMNDVKFVGGHGTMQRPSEGRRGNYPPAGIAASSPSNPVYALGQDIAWDTQHWSLWVTDGGGGTFKDIWTANTYASAGLYVSHTSTPSDVFAMSLEHHVRFECRLNDVHNWNFYAFQFEEESREGPDCQQLTVEGCSNLTFSNLWLYRVIRVGTPRHYGMLLSGSRDIRIRNMHNWTQILCPTEISVYDMDRNLAVWPSDFALCRISGDEASRPSALGAGTASPAAGASSTATVASEPSSLRMSAPVRRLGFGYEFATGAVCDSEGNAYFCEGRLRKVYRYDAAKGTVSLFADLPWRPMSLSVDTQDNLIVICRYYPQPGHMVGGRQEAFRDKLPDDYPNYSGWGNSGWATFAYSIRPDGTDNMTPLSRVKTTAVQGVERVVVPSHRLREDFEAVVQAMPEYSFLGLDGKTIVPETYDLTRSVQLIGYAPGQQRPVYVIREGSLQTARLRAEADGSLKMDGIVANRGKYGLAFGDGKVYVAEGQIFVTDDDGTLLRRHTVDGYPLSLALDPTSSRLYFTTSTDFCVLDLE